MKFALLSSTLPPERSGQAVVLKRLLQDVDPQQYCLISRRNFGANSNNTAGRLPGRHFYLPHELLLRGQSFGLARLHNRVIYDLAVRMGARKIARILRRERCEAVIACTDYLLDVPTGYRASLLAGIPFYVYVFDDYAEKWIPSLERTFAQRVEPQSYKGAAGLIVPNEFMQQALRERYGVASTVIHNACDLSVYEELGEELEESSRTEFKIVFTGAVYDAHYDAFRNLLAALASLTGADAKLHVYTSFSHSELIAQGLRGPVVYHDHDNSQAIPRIQREADVLFLPLAFDSPYPEVIKTSAPAKLGEYLAVRRPVLVHAPANSFIAWYFRHYDCGLVVDQSDPRALAAALERLRSDAELRARLSRNAWARAQADFSVEVAQTRFAQLLQLDLVPANGIEKR